MRTILPYEGIPLRNGAKDLSEAVWFNITECILLLSLLLSESSGPLQADIAHSFVTIPGACRAIKLAIDIGITAENEGEYKPPPCISPSHSLLSLHSAELPALVMTTAFKETVKMSMILSDLNSELARDMARAGYIHVFKTVLYTGTAVTALNRVSLRE